MLRAFSRNLFSLLLVPLLLLGGGTGPGAWHCADGVPCETATATACCCGCSETGAVIAHQCREHAGEAITGDTCGCYYERQHIEAQSSAGQVLVKHLAALPPAGTVLLAPPAGKVCVPALAATGSPPRYLVSPRDTRAPPVA